MAEGLSLSDKRMHLDMLLLRYEVYLKKLYYLIHGEELPAREEGQGATLSNAIFAFPALRGLKNNPKPEYQEFSQRLSMLRQLRNHESHGSLEISEQEVDAAIRIVIDMYLFVTGMNVDNLSDENEATKTPLHSVNYEVREDSDLPMAAENIFVYGSIPVDLPKINRNDLVENKLDLVLMYAIGNPVARKKTEAVGKIALGIKEKVLNEIQKTSYKSVKYLMFHYWKDPKTFQLTKVPLLVEVEDVPADFLVRQPNDAVKYLLLEYNPNEPINMDDINILRTQRRGEIRYMPFVTTIESVTEEK
jgi:type I restriction enzyme R subunit